MNELKQLFLSGGRAVMVNLVFNSPTLVEFVAELGFESVMLDCEHSSASVERIADLTRAAHASGISAIVRPETLNGPIITRYLHCKADGIMVPRVENAEMAREFVDIVRYAMPRDHESIITIAMIESANALSRLDEILEVDGIDVFFLARGDLSKSLGFQGDKTHPEVRARVDEAIEKISRAGRRVGAAADLDNVHTILQSPIQLVFVSARALFEFGGKTYRDRYLASRDKNKIR